MHFDTLWRRFTLCCGFDISANVFAVLNLQTSKPIAVPQQAAIEISAVVGVVEHGLFLDMATTMVVAAPGGVRVITAEGL